MTVQSSRQPGDMSKKIKAAIVVFCVLGLAIIAILLGGWTCMVHQIPRAVEAARGPK